MFKNIVSVIILFLLLIPDRQGLLAQDKNLVGGVSVSDDTIPPHPSAVLDVRSVSKGVIFPQVSYKGLSGISDPAPGLMVYVTDSTEKAGIWFFDGTWQQLKFRKAYYPQGSIIMYSGPVSGYFNSYGEGTHETTKGWHICNGQNGTPNLTDMFVVAWDPSNADYRTYGENTDEAANTYTLEEGQVPEHRHNIPAVTVSKGFPHSHDLVNKNNGTTYTHKHFLYYTDGKKSGSGYATKGKAKVGREYVFEDSGLGLKTEDNLTGISGNIALRFDDYGSETPKHIDNRPACYTLVYIMRTDKPYINFDLITNPRQ